MIENRILALGMKAKLWVLNYISLCGDVKIKNGYLNVRILGNFVNMDQHNGRIINHDRIMLSNLFNDLGK